VSKRAAQADTFRELRVTAGLTQAETAGALGVTRMRVSQWEAGDFSLTLDQLQRFAALIEMPLALLLRELDYDLGEPLSFEDWRRQRKERAADRVHADRLHSTLRHRAHSQPADDANHPDDPDAGTLIRSQGPRSGSHGERIAS
jgi:transcriptional regulator with XRE-family HTH domain